MKAAKDCTSIDDIRDGIDNIDKQIVALVASRAEFVREAAQFKKTEAAVRDPQRVQKVIDTKKELAKTIGAPEGLIEKIYTVMINWFVEAELKDWNSR